jgi:hypothetical protein
VGAGKCDWMPAKLAIFARPPAALVALPVKNNLIKHSYLSMVFLFYKVQPL